MDSASISKLDMPQTLVVRAFDTDSPSTLSFWYAAERVTILRRRIAKQILLKAARMCRNIDKHIKRRKKG